MTPFEVRISFTTPLILSRHGIMLDALLAAAMFDLTQDLRAAHEQIPLVRETGGVWHGSSGFALLDGVRLTQKVIFIAGLSAVRDGSALGLEHAQGKPAGWASGKRNEMTSYESVSHSSLTFFGNGDVAKVEELLSWLMTARGVGKKTRQGFGWIAGVEIEEGADDYSLLLPDGGPARPLPVPVYRGLGGDPSRGRACIVAWKPPYWAPDNRALCVVPNTWELPPGTISPRDCKPYRATSPIKPACRATDATPLPDTHPADLWHAEIGRHLAAAQPNGKCISGSGMCDSCQRLLPLMPDTSNGNSYCQSCESFLRYYRRGRGDKRGGRLVMGGAIIAPPDRTALFLRRALEDGFDPPPGMTVVVDPKDALGAFRRHLYNVALNPPDAPYAVILFAKRSSLGVLELSYGNQVLLAKGNTCKVIRMQVVAQAVAAARHAGLDSNALKAAANEAYKVRMGLSEGRDVSNSVLALTKACRNDGALRALLLDEEGATTLTPDERDVAAAVLAGQPRQAPTPEDA